MSSYSGKPIVEIPTSSISSICGSIVRICFASFLVAVSVEQNGIQPAAGAQQGGLQAAQIEKKPPVQLQGPRTRSSLQNDINQSATHLRDHPRSSKKARWQPAVGLLSRCCLPQPCLCDPWLRNKRLLSLRCFKKVQVFSVPTFHLRGSPLGL